MLRARRFAILSAVAAIACGSAAALAGTSWDGIKTEVYGTRTIKDGLGVIHLTAPYRPDNVMAVPLVADVKLPAGQTLKRVSFVVDENPSPVAAVFDLAGNRSAAALTAHIRLNQQSDVHIVAETTNGDLYAIEQLVKFAGGQASCSAPPSGDPKEIIANMGKMNFALIGEKATASLKPQKARIDLNHPNHTGMVLDQITLLYVPMLMVDKIEVRQGDDVVFNMAGSITVAQNPAIEFDYITNGATELTVIARDTSGKTWEHKFPIGPAS